MESPAFLSIRFLTKVILPDQDPQLNLYPCIPEQLNLF